MSPNVEHVRTALAEAARQPKVIVRDWMVTRAFENAELEAPAVGSSKFEAVRNETLAVAWTGADRIIETYGLQGSESFRHELDLERERAVEQIDEVERHLAFVLAVNDLLSYLQSVGPTALVVDVDRFERVRAQNGVVGTVDVAGHVRLDYGAVFRSGRPAGLYVLSPVEGETIKWAGDVSAMDGPVLLQDWLQAYVPEFSVDETVDFSTSDAALDTEPILRRREEAYRTLDVVALRQSVLEEYLSAIVQTGHPNPVAPPAVAEDDRRERQRQERAALLRTSPEFVTAAIAVLIQQDGPHSTVKTTAAAYEMLAEEVETTSPGATLALTSKRKAREALPGGVENVKILGLGAFQKSTYESHEHLLMFDDEVP